MKCSKFLTGVGSIQTPYFLRIGSSSSSSLVIEAAKPGESWSSDIFWGKGGLGGAIGGGGERREFFHTLGKGVFFKAKW
jgi:hypothetical protein